MSRQSIHGRDPGSGEFIEVLVEDGVIRSVAPAVSGEEDLWLSPGFIDLQVNGYAGCDLNAESITPEVVTALTYKLFAVGVTTFLPTLITAPEGRIVAGLAAIAEARRQSPVVKRAIPFVHIEGPHLAPAEGPRGAHSRDGIRPPDIAEFDRWQAVSGGLVGTVTLSPHWDQALPYIAHLASRGCVVAIGHTDAESSRIHEAAEAGATLSTHLGNGVAGNLPRHPNLLWAQLADDRLSATFIADGHHLPADTLQAMLRAKGPERCILISDAVALAGMPPGRYETPVGGTVELTADGRIGIPGTRNLAGAALPLRSGIANVARLPGFSLGEAILMATKNPGRFAGGRGVLRAGADADLVRFRWDRAGGDFEIVDVLVRGTAP
ncbi:MAG TPA: amidohydrolase family protein [Acidobacteriaceae bacterium]|nr:amidohydrolase family protein [Acidobacteriaceae bacterium]